MNLTCLLFLAGQTTYFEDVTMAANDMTTAESIVTNFTRNGTSPLLSATLLHPNTRPESKS